MLAWVELKGMGGGRLVTAGRVAKEKEGLGGRSAVNVWEVGLARANDGLVGNRQLSDRLFGHMSWCVRLSRKKTEILSRDKAKLE